MVPRTQFYDPMIDSGEQPTQMRGFQVGIGGTYVLLDDVVTVLRQYAQSLPDPDQAGLVHEIATWLTSGESMPEPIEVEEPLPLAVDQPPYGAEALDESPDIGRIEIYPDPPEDPRPKWYARSVDTGGYIMQVTNGSFDQDWVIENARERWPGKDVYLLKHAGQDSKWEEDALRGVFPSKGPPIRRLFSGAGR